MTDLQIHSKRRLCLLCAFVLCKRCEESTLATSRYGVDVTGVVRRGKVYGMQFHPEKSGQVGLNLLKAFSEL